MSYDLGPYARANAHGCFLRLWALWGHDVPQVVRGRCHENSPPHGLRRAENDESPGMRGVREMRRRGLEPPPGYPGPGPQTWRDECHMRPDRAKSSIALRGARARQHQPRPRYRQAVRLPRPTPHVRHARGPGVPALRRAGLHGPRRHRHDDALRAPHAPARRRRPSRRTRPEDERVPSGYPSGYQALTEMSAAERNQGHRAEPRTAP